MLTQVLKLRSETRRVYGFLRARDLPEDSLSAAMDFWQIVKKRFMCRSYLDRDVPNEVLDRILEVVDHLPSAGHTQPQELIVIRNQNTKESLALAALGQRYVAEAPLDIVVVSDTRRSKQRYGRRGEEFYSIVDGAFAAMLLMLACINEGLGAAFVGAFDDEAVRAVLQLPNVVRPIGIISIGYCAEKGDKLSRLPRHRIIHYETWEE
jgi:nitroreductase